MLQDRFENGELRWQSLGMVDGHLVLLAAHTVGEDDEGTEILRIISARKADSKERKRYEQDCETRGRLGEPLTTDGRPEAKLAALAVLPDSQIDHSDIPPLTDEFWKRATRNPFYKPTKQATTVRVDADVLMWLKGQGKG